MPRRGENIRKRKDGRWEGRYYTHEVRAGKNVLRSVYAKTYGEVKQKLSVAKNNSEIQKNCDNSKIFFDTVAEEWLAVIASEKKHSTYIKYRTVYEKHIKNKLGKTVFSELDGKILKTVFQNTGGKSLSYSLQSSISCVINQIYSHASLNYRITGFQYPPQRRKVVIKPVEILNTSEQAKLMQYLYDEMDICKLGVVLCISTGLRLGEICALKWTDIDFECAVIHVNTTVQRIAVEGQNTKTILLEGKTKSSCSKREIPLSDELMKLLSQYYPCHEKYILNRNKPMEPRTYQNKFQKYLRIAGVKKKNFHILRHTFATNCVSRGMDVKCLSEILGHSDVKITLNRYVHPTVETKRRYMNLLSDIYGQFTGR